jgi:hypothetical protein
MHARLRSKRLCSVLPFPRNLFAAASLIGSKVHPIFVLLMVLKKSDTNEKIGFIATKKNLIRMKKSDF